MGVKTSVKRASHFGLAANFRIKADFTQAHVGTKFLYCVSGISIIKEPPSIQFRV